MAACQSGLSLSDTHSIVELYCDDEFRLSLELEENHLGLGLDTALPLEQDDCQDIGKSGRIGVGFVGTCAVVTACFFCRPGGHPDNGADPRAGVPADVGAEHPAGQPGGGVGEGRRVGAGVGAEKQFGVRNKSGE